MALIAASIGAEPALAALGQTQPVKITRVTSYNDFHGGDVYFSVESPNAGCELGFWLSPQDPGFKTNLSVILIARSTSTPVIATYDDAALWTGSATRACHLYAITM